MHAGKWQVSTGGGAQARWNGENEILFGSLDLRVMSAPVDVRGEALEVGKVTTHFTSRASGIGSMWDMLPGGERLLINTLPATVTAVQTPITVVLNWPAAVKR